MIIALFQPDIPHNAGTLARLARCLGLELHIIGPAGFTLDDKGFRRAGLDYLDQAAVKQHDDWEAFCIFCKAHAMRIVLMTTKASASYLDFKFSRDDVLLFGRESSGVPDVVHDVAAARLLIPMVEKARSLNLALSAAMVVGEAMRQTAKLPVLNSATIDKK